MTVRDAIFEVVLDSVRDLSKIIGGPAAISNLIGGDSSNLIGGDGSILTGGGQ